MADAPIASSVAAPRGLGRLTPTGRAIVPAGWALYDFANTIFSFAVVSGAIGLWLIRTVSDAPREAAGIVAPPERLSPAAAPLEPRS